MPSVREFQSTHPARGATIGCRGHSVLHHGISIHAPREGCDISAINAGCSKSISIHAPREGCDCGAGRAEVK